MFSRQEPFFLLRVDFKIHTLMLSAREPVTGRGNSSGTHLSATSTNKESKHLELSIWEGRGVWGKLLKGGVPQENYIHPQLKRPRIYPKQRRHSQGTECRTGTTSREASRPDDSGDKLFFCSHELKAPKRNWYVIFRAHGL